MKRFYYLDSNGNKVAIPNYRVNTDTISEIKLGLDSKLSRAEFLAHKQDYSNPHQVTKAQVGLGLVDNTPDNLKPVSTYQKTELDKKENLSNKITSLSETSTNTQYPSAKAVYDVIVENERTIALAWSQLGSELRTHASDNTNPHGVTKSQVGLGNVDNTSDLNKPISTATQTELDKKVDKTITVNGHPLSSNVSVTKGDVSLGNVDNTSDLNKPISTATQTELDKKVDKVSGSSLLNDTTKAGYDSHVAAKSNPHGVTKSQVGLGNVDNTSDLNKPISTATQTELNKKVDKTITVNGHPLSSNVSVTKGDVSLGNVDNTSDANKPISTAAQTALDKKVDKVSGSSLLNDTTKAGYDSHVAAKSNPHGVTKSQVGLGNVDNTSDLNKPISTATQTELDKKVDKTITVNGHPLSSNVSVTKGDVSLGNVDNTSDANKPISNAQKIEFSKKPNFVVKATGTNTSYNADSVLRYTPQGLTEEQRMQALRNLGLAEGNLEVYGVRHNYSLASPTLERIGNLELHKTLPVQSLMKRCLLDDSGEVICYLSPGNSENKDNGEVADLSGAGGQVMVEVPEHYRRFTLDEAAQTYDCEISLNPFPGCHKVNKFYISAFEATIQRSTSKLSSVINTSADYRGGGNQSGWDGTYRSVLGLPMTTGTVANYRTWARNRGAGWGCMEWDIYNVVFWLFTVEYATLNCQTGFTNELTPEGYKKGGLGSGVTGMPNWGDYNGYYPIVPCGVTKSLGNNSGVVTHNVTGSTGSTVYAAPVPSYRGIENPYGHIWKHTDGFLGIGNGTTQDYYLCRSRAHYSSSKNEYYQKVGTSPTGTNGYMTACLKNQWGDMLCTALGGGTSTYFCDYHYNAHASGTVYCLICGGDSDDGADAGFGYLASNFSVSLSSADVGSRLCWVPESVPSILAAI